MKFEIEKFTPTKGRVIVKKTRELTKIVKNIVPDDEANKGKNPVEDTLEVKEIKEKATKANQVGVIVAVHPEDNYKVGQTIVYGIHNLKEFDLIPGKYGLLDAYNILGVYEN